MACPIDPASSSRPSYPTTVIPATAQLRAGISRAGITIRPCPGPNAEIPDNRNTVSGKTMPIPPVGAASAAKPPPNCSGQVISDTSIGVSAVHFRS